MPRRALIRLLVSVLLLGAWPLLAEGTGKQSCLPKPTALYPWWNGGFDFREINMAPYTSYGTGTDRWGVVVKQLTWQLAERTGVSGFKVYEQAPGGAFVVAHTIDFSQYDMTKNIIQPSFSSALTGTQLQMSPMVGGGVYVTFYESRPINGWPVGTYRNYVVTYNYQGQESAPSSTVSSTYLGTGNMTTTGPGVVTMMPLGGVSRALPPLQWMDAALQVPLKTKQMKRHTEICFWGGPFGPIPLETRTFLASETSTTPFYTATAFEPNQTYHVAHMTWVANPKMDYCPCFAISLPVSFTMQLQAQE